MVTLMSTAFLIKFIPELPELYVQLLLIDEIVFNLNFLIELNSLLKIKHSSLFFKLLMFDFFSLLNTLSLLLIYIMYT